MKSIQWVLALLVAAGCASSAMAQTIKLRPGLWEVQSSVKTSSGRMEAAMSQMQEQLAKMPPEQRRQVQEMMAARGMKPSTGTMGSSLKVCLTQKDVDMDNMPTREGCTHKTSRSGPNTVHVSFQCPGGNGEAPSKGEGTMTFDGPTAYRGQHKITTTTHGQPEEMDITQKGTWLSADCGAVKPMDKP